MNVVHLIIIDGAKVKALAVRHGDVIEKLLPRKDRADHLTVFEVAEERGMVAVGKGVGIDLVDKHSRLARGKEQADRTDQQKHQHDRKIFAAGFFQYFFHHTTSHNKSHYIIRHKDKFRNCKINYRAEESGGGTKVVNSF